MTHHERLIVVTGATGKQGGAVIRHLSKQGGWKLRAVTRHPESEAARALAAQGIEVVQGDMANRADMDRALQGAYGVFSVQNTWEAGVDGEIAQGKNVADAAKAAGVQHFVYTSVGGAERATGHPAFRQQMGTGTVSSEAGAAGHHAAARILHGQPAARHDGAAGWRPRNRYAARNSAADDRRG